MNRPKEHWQHLSPAARLATAYVAIIMAISLMFTAALFHLSSGQLSDSLRREYLRFRPFVNFDAGDTSVNQQPPDISEYLNELAIGRRHLALELAYFNLVILVLASLASYQLARRTLRPIEEALEAQTRFAGDASHELRTPLTAMQTEIEVALRNPKLDAGKSRQLLASNLEEVGKLRALSDGLLRLARGNGQLELAPVSLDEVFRQALDRNAKSASAKSIQVSVKGKGVEALGDAPTLVELVSILLDNAIKYCPAGTPVEVGLAIQNKQAVLAVRDKGPGITQEDLPHIFERFYRVDSSRSKELVEGYGLGLSIAQKIVEAHHGSIAVESEQGKGATFTVRLPLA